MTSASIQKLIMKLLRSNNNEDVEDVVRLVCLLDNSLKDTIEEQKIYKQLQPQIEDEHEDEECDFEEQEQTELPEKKEETTIKKIYQHLLLQTEEEDKDEEANFEEQEQTKKSQKEEEPIIKKIFSLSPRRNSPNPKHQTGARKKRKSTTLQSKKNARRKANFQHETKEGPIQVQRNELSFKKLENDEEETMIKQKVGPTTSPGFKHQTPAEKRKSKRKLAYETNFYHVKINEHTFEKLEENVLIIQRLEMEKARIQEENDELKDQLMKLNKQMEEQIKKAKTQMEVKYAEIVLLNERIAMLVESNVYLDSQEEQIAVEVEATTPKKSPLVSSMIKRVKNRETKKEYKDPDFWYIMKKQPKQNEKVDKVEPMVEEIAKTRKEDETQHQHLTKEIDTSYPVFHKLQKKSRMKLTSLWATKINSDKFCFRICNYSILQGKEVGSYLYLDDIGKIVKCEELSGNDNSLKDTIEEQKIYKQLQPQIEDEHEDEECDFEEQEQTELPEKKEETTIKKIYQHLLLQTEKEDKDEEANFEEQEQTKKSQKEEEPIIKKIFSLSPRRNSPNPKHQTGARKKRKSTTLQSKKNARRKANFQHETEEGPVHVQRNELSFENLENDEEETMIK
ncbi:nucleoprotein TPR-like [Camellia sinensis]|uniref:nucleoprotein TPR-like n=1 Tax=Camellia sinensis TaxID=4442 RepID=UPI001036E7F4|nr:nucleoprotein TPR-like [Camellia sinensis]